MRTGCIEKALPEAIVQLGKRYGMDRYFNIRFKSLKIIQLFSKDCKTAGVLEMDIDMDFFFLGVPAAAWGR